MASVQLLHLVKKHSGSREPVDAKGQPVKATKGRAKLALANIRKKLAMSGDVAAQQRAFQGFARETSDDPMANTTGGDLGRVEAGSLEKAVEA